MVQELEKLASLKQQGILSEEEFQQMKARLLSSS
ncbi:MAG: SHOCT domain-containing protein [Nitrososphaeraceae archaeon]